MKTGITIICLSLANTSFAQEEILNSINNALSQQLSAQSEKEKTGYTLETGNNIPSTLLKSSFFFYKNFISPQDFSNCTFTPSCSEYAKIALEEKGVVKGYLMTFDRLCRCNGLSPSKYQLDPETGRLVDEVR
jgi:putative component of membrane protein insertase Oxa1/YidC/SpoIIIJ protein YidD